MPPNSTPSNIVPVAMEVLPTSLSEAICEAGGATSSSSPPQAAIRATSVKAAQRARWNGTAKDMGERRQW